MTVILKICCTFATSLLLRLGSRNMRIMDKHGDKEKSRGPSFIVLL